MSLGRLAVSWAALAVIAGAVHAQNGTRTATTRVNLSVATYARLSQTTTPGVTSGTFSVALPITKQSATVSGFQDIVYHVWANAAATLTCVGIGTGIDGGTPVRTIVWTDVNINWTQSNTANVPSVAIGSGANALSKTLRLSVYKERFAGTGWDGTFTGSVTVSISVP